uniref:Uncharacterized protein n=1 Tax=Electrophorus electricus TaxID=8005 RepID=A0AAY5EB85_ELEEL
FCCWIFRGFRVSQLCDGKLDCPNGFDELSCLHECSDPGNVWIRCLLSLQLPYLGFLMGSCVLRVGHFLCKNRMKCIERTLVCDGRNDCPDDSDELRCPTCPLHCDEGSSCTHRCDNKTRCIPETFLCDGEKDCVDGTDEAGCRGNCNEHQLTFIKIKLMRFHIVAFILIRRILGDPVFPSSSHCSVLSGPWCVMAATTALMTRMSCGVLLVLCIVTRARWTALTRRTAVRIFSHYTQAISVNVLALTVSECLFCRQ